jgi:hypothetical protein
MTAIGSNFPYDFVDNDRTWASLDALSPSEITVMSHTPIHVLENIKNRYQNIEYWHIRTKTGWANKGYWPGNIIDYQEWDNETTTRDQVEWMIANGITPHVILGNEPNIELTLEPVTDPATRSLAIEGYVQWFMYNRIVLNDDYGTKVKIAVAPLALGDPDNYYSWDDALGQCYTSSDFFSGHLYSNGYDLDDPNWVGMVKYYLTKGLPVHINELGIRDNFNINGQYSKGATLAKVINRINSDVKCVSLFTVRGGAQDYYKPVYWFLGENDMNDVKEFAPVIEYQNVPEEVKSMSPYDQAMLDLWGSYPVGDGFFNYWKDHILEMGSPTGYEHPDSECVYQAFTRGIYKYVYDTAEVIKVA